VRGYPQTGFADIRELLDGLVPCSRIGRDIAIFLFTAALVSLSERVLIPRGAEPTHNVIEDWPSAGLPRLASLHGACLVVGWRAPWWNVDFHFSKPPQGTPGV